MAQKFTVPITVKQLSSTGSDAVTVFVDADTYARLKIEAGGRLTWGPGSGPGDTNLYRDAENVLKTDDTFKAAALFVDGIEIDTTGATENQILKYDGTKFAPATGGTGGGAEVIDDLTDVTITSVASGDFLQWNGTAWVNQPDGLVPSGGFEGQILSKTTDTDHDIQWIDNYTGDLRIVCKNDSGVTISKGQAVMAVGSVGDRIKIEKAVADGSVSAKYMLGVAAENISDATEGYVQMLGEVRNLDTSLLSVGTVLYIDPNTPGALTSTEPTAPDLAESVAIVTRSHESTGIIFVRMWSQGESVSELHDVDITSLTSGDFLKYNGSAWVNDAINLGTDTVGNYVSSLVAGTGITLSNNSGEGATPTIAVTSNTYDAYNSSRNVEIKLLMEVL